MLVLMSMHSKPEAPSIAQAVWEVGQRLRAKMALLRRARALPEGTGAATQMGAAGLVVESQTRPVPHWKSGSY